MRNGASCVGEGDAWKSTTAYMGATERMPMMTAYGSICVDNVTVGLRGYMVEMVTILTWN
jgi:hypothetical protein